jgi:hypothetical protein
MEIEKAKKALEGYTDGDSVYCASVFVQDGFVTNGGGLIKTNCWVHQAEVFSVRHGMIQLGAHVSPRAVSCGETIHATAAAAWAWCAGQLRAGAFDLGAAADEAQQNAAVASQAMVQV